MTSTTERSAKSMDACGKPNDIQLPDIKRQNFISFILPSQYHRSLLVITVIGLRGHVILKIKFNERPHKRAPKASP